MIDQGEVASLLTTRVSHVSCPSEKGFLPLWFIFSADTLTINFGSCLADPASVLGSKHRSLLALNGKLGVGR